MIQTVPAVERQIGDRENCKEAEKPPGRNHVRCVPERIVDDLNEEKRRDAQHDGDRDGSLGGRASAPESRCQYGFEEKLPTAARPSVPSITLTAVT